MVEAANPYEGWDHQGRGALDSFAQLTLDSLKTAKTETERLDVLFSLLTCAKMTMQAGGAPKRAWMSLCELVWDRIDTTIGGRG